MKQISKITMSLLLLLVFATVGLKPATAKASQATIDAEFAGRELSAAQAKILTATSLVERVLAEQNVLDIQAKYEKVIARSIRTKSSARFSPPTYQAKVDPRSGSDS